MYYSCPDQQFLDHLEARTENNVAWFKANNHRMVPVLAPTHTQGGTSPSAISRQNREALAFFESQGDLQQRLEEFAVNPQMSAVSVAALHIPGWLDPKASLDLMTTAGLTLDQGRAMRQAGFGLASEKDMSREASIRQLPMEHRKVRLEVKVREREVHEKINVRPTSLLSM